MPLALYSLTAVALLWLMNRLVCRASLWARVLLFLLPFAFVGYALVANRVYAPIERTYQDPPLSDFRAEHGIGEPHNPVSTDIYTQMIPWRHVVREALARGEWPLWNPFILGGDVLAASAQSAPYSPFTLIAILMPAAISFTFTAAMTFFLAAAATFAFARELECRESVAIFAAAGWMTSTAIVLYVLWPLGICWALLPFVLLATHRSVHAPGVASWALLTTSFTLLILAGHPESVLHIVTIGAVYGAFLWAQRRRWTSLATALAAGAVALLLSAIYLLPIADAIPQSAEYAYRHGVLAKADWRGAKPADLAVRMATNAFPFLHLRNVTDPKIEHLRGETGVVGSIVLALAVFAVVRVRSRATWFFGAMTVFCLLAGAEWRPIIRLFQKLPLFDIALHERFAFATGFFLVTLAAIALEHILRSDDHVAAALVLGATCIVLGIGTWWIHRAWAMEGGPITWGRYKVAAELVGLAVATAALGRRHTAPMLVALLLFQRVASEGGAWVSYPARAAYPPVPLFEPLQRIREPFRVTGLGFAMIPGTNALYGLEDVRGYEAMTLTNLVETYRLWCVPQVVFFNRIDDLTRPFVSMMNVRFAVARSDAPVPEGWRVIGRQHESVLLENARVLPRAFVPRRVTLGLDNTFALNEMEKVTDFREHGWITAEDTVVQSRENGPGRVDIQRRGFNEYVLTADMDALGWVIVSESNWRGWRAYLDGQRVAVHRANVAFLGVLVPPGRHAVRLVYRPRAFDAGLRISALTLLMLIGFAVLRARRRR